MYFLTLTTTISYPPLIPGCREISRSFSCDAQLLPGSFGGESWLPANLCRGPRRFEHRKTVLKRKIIHTKGPYLSFIGLVWVTIYRKHPYLMVKKTWFPVDFPLNILKPIQWTLLYWRVICCYILFIHSEHLFKTQKNTAKCSPRSCLEPQGMETWTIHEKFTNIWGAYGIMMYNVQCGYF